uniref:Uncharacterized protein n=1 Tax=Setaria italica TaxID=4555 RepID=K3YX35_SETIT
MQREGNLIGIYLDCHIAIEMGQAVEDQYHVNKFSVCQEQHHQRTTMADQTCTNASNFSLRESITNGDQRPRQCSDCCCTSKFTTILQRYHAAKRM